MEWGRPAMHNQPTDNSNDPARRRLLEAIDACRPTSAGDETGDLDRSESEFLAEHLRQQPADRALLENSQAFDQGVRRHIEEVDVPVGLADRILTAVGQQATGDVVGKAVDAAADVEPAAETVELAARATPTNGSSQRMRRGLLWVGAPLAAAAGIYLLVTSLTARATLSGSEIETAAGFWLEEQTQRATRPFASAPRDYPPSPRVNVAANTTTWANIRSFLGRTGVVYYLRNAAGDTASLIVIPHAGSSPQSPRLDVSANAPITPVFTMGRTTDVWIENKLVHVLVVNGDRAAFDRFMGRSGPIAAIRRATALGS